MTYLIFRKFDLVKIIYDALAIVMVLAVCNLMWFLTRLVLLFFCYVCSGECFFWYLPIRLVPDKRPLNGCCCYMCSLFSISVFSSRSQPFVPAILLISADSYRLWARGRCRISPPRFLAECCKRQLNQVSCVLLYFRLSTFSDLY